MDATASVVCRCCWTLVIASIIAKADTLNDECGNDVDTGCDGLIVDPAMNGDEAMKEGNPVLVDDVVAAAVGAVADAVAAVGLGSPMWKCSGCRGCEFPKIFCGT